MVFSSLENYKRFQNSLLLRSLREFNLGDRNKLILTVITTTLLAGLDLLGVMLVGIVTSIAFNGLTSSPLGDSTQAVIKSIKIDSMSLESQIVILSLVVVLLFISKSIFSMYLNRRLLHFLSMRSARLSEKLIQEFFELPMEKFEGKPIQSSIYTLTSAPGMINLGIVGASIHILSDLFLLVFVLLGLFFVDFLTTVGLVVLYSLLVFLMVKFTHDKVAQLGSEIASLTIGAREGINELSSTFRELSVRGLKANYAANVGKLQYKFARREAELNFLATVGKYIFEITMVISISLMVLYQLQTQSASRTVAVSAIFVAASLRIMPALLRLQQNLLGIRKNFSMTKGAFDLIDEIHQNRDEISAKVTQSVGEFTPSIELKNLNFSYKNSGKKVFEDLNFDIYAGRTVGIVGKSGIGKSTLVDLILGLLKPDQGEIKISRVDPMMAIRVWPGQISYLPQKTFLLPGTVRKNLALGYKEGSFSDAQYLNALSVVDLANDLKGDTGLLDFVLTEDATNISGGQRQRIGIARAILGNPKLLVLDEATSSLDATTEETVMLSLRKLLPHATLVFITHKKTTLTFCDSVIDLNQRTEILKES